MKLTIKYAFIDVTTGREALADRFAARPASGPCPEQMRVPICISGYIDDTHSVGDGTSQEFVMVVEKVELPK